MTVDDLTCVLPKDKRKQAEMAAEYNLSTRRLIFGSNTGMVRFKTPLRSILQSS